MKPAVTTLLAVVLEAFCMAEGRKEKNNTRNVYKSGPNSKSFVHFLSQQSRGRRGEGVWVVKNLS